MDAWIGHGCLTVATLQYSKRNKTVLFIRLQPSGTLQGLSHDRVLQVQHRTLCSAPSTRPQRRIPVLHQRDAVQLDQKPVGEKSQIKVHDKQL